MYSDENLGMLHSW